MQSCVDGENDEQDRAEADWLLILERTADHFEKCVCASGFLIGDGVDLDQIDSHPSIPRPRLTAKTKTARDSPESLARYRSRESLYLCRVGKPRSQVSIFLHENTISVYSYYNYNEKMSESACGKGGRTSYDASFFLSRVREAFGRLGPHLIPKIDFAIIEASARVIATHLEVTRCTGVYLVC